MEYNNINGTAKRPQTTDLVPVRGQKDATVGVKTGNNGGKNRQQMGEKEATATSQGVKTGNCEVGILPQEWLYNPLVYSQISGDFSLLQQRILVGVLSRLQDRILYTINEKEQNKRFPSLFTDEEMEPVIRLDVEPTTLGITPDHYQDLEKALEELTMLTMAFPKYIKGSVKYVIAPLFARIEVERGNVRRTGSFRVYILRKNAEDFFSLAHGYTVHLARITQLAKKKRTPRIYIFLSSFQEIGHKEIEYQAFCQFLGIDEDTARADLVMRLNELVSLHEQEERDNVKPGKRRGITKRERNERLKKWENPFRKFNKVRSQILEPTQQELDEFVAHGDIDFSFTFDPLYKTGNRRGNPTHIRFIIKKGPLALERDAVVLRRRRLLKFATAMCQWCKDIKQQALLAITDPMHDCMIEDFTNYGYVDVRKLVEQQQPDDVAAYTMRMLRQWTDENLPKYTQRHYGELWEKCKSDLISNATNDDSRRRLQGVSFQCFEQKNNRLVLRTTASIYEWLESPSVIGYLAQAINRHFPTKPALGYSIISG